MIKIVTGDITDAKEKYICHQVNCQGAMGSGVARVIYYTWPQVREQYLKFARNEIDGKAWADDEYKKSLLGSVQMVDVSPNKDGSQFVLNIFGQYNCGREEDHCYTDYKALEEAFNKIARGLKQDEAVAFPYGFGCGLAGGEWEMVLALMDKCFAENDVIIYKFPGQPDIPTRREKTLKKINQKLNSYSDARLEKFSLLIDLIEVLASSEDGEYGKE